MRGEWKWWKCIISIMVFIAAITALIYFTLESCVVYKWIFNWCAILFERSYLHAICAIVIAIGTMCITGVLGLILFLVFISIFPPGED